MTTSLHLLIVEDQPDDAELMLRELRRAGFVVDWQRVETRQGLLDVLRSGSPPDLVLSDYTLPQFSGLEVLQTLHRLGLDVPCIIVSGTLTEEMAVTVLKEGAYDFVVKDRLTRLGAAARQAIEQAFLRQEKRRAELALQESETKYRQLVERANDGIVIIQDLRIQFANARMSQLCGYSVEEMVGSHFSRFVHPDDVAVLTDRYQRRMAGETVSPIFETQLLNKFGHIVYAEINAGLVQFDGRPADMVMVRDITERKVARAELQKRQSEFEALVNNATDIILRLDPDFRHIYVNPAVAKITGRPVEDFLGKRIGAVNDKPYDPTFWEQILTYGLETGQEQTVEAEVETVDGVRIFQCRVVPEKDDAGIVKSQLIVGRDITDQKEAEKTLWRLLTELSALHSVAMAGAELFEEDALIQRVTELVGQVFNADNYGVMLMNEKENRLYRHPGYVIPPEFPILFPELGEGVVGQVTASGQALRIGNVHQHPGYIPLVPAVQSEMCVPLKAEDRILGVINVESLERDAFGEADERLMISIAGQLATVLQNTRLHRAALEDARRWAVLYQASQEIVNSPLDLEHIYQAIHRATAQLMPSESFIIVLYDEVRHELNAVYLYDRQGRSAPQRAPAHLGYSGWVIGHRAPLWVQDNQQDDTGIEPLRFGDPENTRSKLFVPLLLGGKVMGVMSTQSYITNAYIQENLRMLEMLAAQATVALENARHFQQSERHLQRLQALHTIDTTITASLDLRIILNVLLEQVTSQLQVDAAAVLLLHASLRSLEYTAWRGFHSEGLSRRSLRLNQGLAGQAVMKQTMLHVPDLSEIESPLQQVPLLEAERFISYFAFPLVAKGETKGVLELYHRTRFEPEPGWMDFLATLATQAAIAIDNASLFEGLQRANVELMMAYDTTLEGWSRALEMRDMETEGHCQRVTDLAVRLALRLGIPEAQLVHVRRGALLHDIGKMSIPDSILHKAGPLDEAEWQIMRQHPTYAHHLLSSIPFLRPALDIPHYHHEKWDGTGYPEGLKGEQIPLAARIFAVIDVWDALGSDRPYRSAWPRDKIVEHIRSQAGSHFDPQVAQVFLQIMQDEAQDLL